MALAVAGFVHANSIDLRGPGGLLGPTDTYGRLSHQVEYQEIDAGEGFTFPFRFIFESSAQKESPYGWSGWRVPVLESTALAWGDRQVVVQLLCGKRLFLNVNSSNEPETPSDPGNPVVGDPSTGGGSSGGGSSSSGSSSGGGGGGSSSAGSVESGGGGPGSWAGTNEPDAGSSPDREWTVVKDVHPNTEIVTFTITRWDGWEMVYREGRLIRLTSDRGRVAEWQYTGPGERLSRIVSSPSNAVLLQVNYAGSAATSPVSSISVNGDSYGVNISSDLLLDVTHPDGTADSFGYGNYSAANLVASYGFSNPQGGDASLIHTDRYQVSREFYWNPANLLLARDDVWSYFFTYPEASNLAPGSNLASQSSAGPTLPPGGGGASASDAGSSGGGSSSGGGGGSSSGGTVALPGGNSDPNEPDPSDAVYDSRRINRSYSPDVTRTRIATGETESIQFSGADDSIRTVTRGGHSRRLTESRSFGASYGKVTKVEVKRNGQWEIVRYLAYDTDTGRVIRVTDANLQDTVFTYTDHPGAPTVAPPFTKTITDPTNRVRVYEYDLRGNLVRRTSGGVTRRYEYDSRDRLQKVRNNANAVVAEYGYNDNDRVTSRKDAAGNTTSFTYLDRYGESLLEKVILPSDDGPAGEFSAKFFYDGKGNLIAFTDASGETWDFTPNPENLTQRITDPLDHETDFTYDARANLTEISDALDQVTALGYNDLDLIDSVTDALEHTSDYTSNAAYQLTGLADNRDKTYGFEYDSNQFRDELEFPDTTKVTADYGLDGRLDVWTSRGGGTYTVTDRDDAGRIEAATSSYGTFSRDVTYGYDANKRLETATATVGSIAVSQSFGYDSEGRANSFTQGIRTAGLTYDANGRLETITYPAGFTVTYVHNVDGQLDQIRKDTDLLVQYHYDDAGRLEWREDGNGVRVTYGADILSRTDAITIVKLQTPGYLWTEYDGYNGVGDRDFTVRQLGNGGTPPSGDVYRYDATGQLTGVKYDALNPQDRYDLAVSVGNDAHYGYDAAGNRDTVTEGASTGSYAVNDLNQYTATPGSITPGYNSRGDLTDFNTASASDWEFGYDAEGHLVTAQIGTNEPIRYHYDAFGERVAKQDGTDFEWYLNVGSEMLEAFDATTVSTTSYIYASGIDQPVAQVDDSGNVEFLYQDVLGNIVLVASETGVALERYRYNVWGSVTATDFVGNPVSVPRSRFLFTGRELDREIGLYHYRTRAYSPQIGRFMQMDSIDFGGGDLNLYRYVSNNPVNWIDPYGLDLDMNRFASTDRGERIF